jgi:glycine/D-amino acid oxidase-like deaminating enzyme
LLRFEPRGITMAFTPRMTIAHHPALIIGAGVVGLSTELYLQRSGIAVTVLDPLAPAGGASFGNAGMLSPDTATPIAMPGILRKLPGWLRDPLGPLAVRPSYFPLLRWSTPDSLPILGSVSGHPGLYLAFGHGHFGMSGGPAEWPLLARLITGQSPGIDPA